MDTKELTEKNLADHVIVGCSECGKEHIPTWTQFEELAKTGLGQCPLCNTSAAIKGSDYKALKRATRVDAIKGITVTTTMTLFILSALALHTTYGLLAAAATTLVGIIIAAVLKSIPTHSFIDISLEKENEQTTQTSDA